MGLLAWLSWLLGAEPSADERPICGDCQRRGPHAEDCPHAPAVDEADGGPRRAIAPEGARKPKRRPGSAAKPNTGKTSPKAPARKKAAAKPKPRRKSR